MLHRASEAGKRQVCGSKKSPVSFFLFFFFNVGEENQRLRLKERKGEEESGFMGHPQDATLHTQLVLSCHTHEVTRVF